MNCGRSDNELALYVEADLAPAKAAELEAHLSSCRECRDVVDELRETQDVFKSIRQETVSTAALAQLRTRVLEELERRPANRWWGRWIYAVAGAVFVVVVMVGVSLIARHHSSATLESGKVSTKRQVPSSSMLWQ